MQEEVQAEEVKPVEKPAQVIKPAATKPAAKKSEAKKLSLKMIKAEELVQASNAAVKKAP